MPPRLQRRRKAHPKSARLIRPLTWRYLGELPQAGNRARVAGLYRVREGSFRFGADGVLTGLLRSDGTDLAEGLAVRGVACRNASSAVDRRCLPNRT